MFHQSFCISADDRDMFTRWLKEALGLEQLFVEISLVYLPRCRESWSPWHLFLQYTWYCLLLPQSRQHHPRLLESTVPGSVSCIHGWIKELKNKRKRLGVRLHLNVYPTALQFSYVGYNPHHQVETFKLLQGLRHLLPVCNAEFMRKIP